MKFFSTIVTFLLTAQLFFRFSNSQYATYTFKDLMNEFNENELRQLAAEPKRIIPGACPWNKWGTDYYLCSCVKGVEEKSECELIEKPDRGVNPMTILSNPKEYVELECEPGYTEKVGCKNCTCIKKGIGFLCSADKCSNEEKIENVLIKKQSPLLSLLNPIFSNFELTVSAISNLTSHNVL